jgi:subfamily B ATP-binding cassette protein HlyB/CyaB
MWGLAAMCRLHRLPFSSGLVLQQFPPPYRAATLTHAAAALGLKTVLREARVGDLRTLAAPFLAVLGPARAAGQPEDEGHEEADGLAVVLGIERDEIRYLVPGSAESRMKPIAEFEREYAGTVLLCRPQAAAPVDEDATPEAAFGFRWFVPELMRHRKVWRDVLAASFAIQLVALAVPLCTQVVIDKVVVHQTLDTLVVIALALAIFLVFNAAMSWVRQYLVLHTGNRVDAVLGTRTFEHLLELPLRYFEHRPTGVLVARLHGVETIREFVSGAAVSLLLDLPFLFVFIGVMFYYSWLLSLVTLAILFVIAAMSVAIVPAVRARLDRQFLLGARNTAFLTEYVSGMETVKSLQMEPQLRQRFGSYLASYLEAGFRTRQLSNTYTVAANGLEQLMTCSILCAGAWLAMRNAGFTIGMLVAYQMFAGRLSQPLLRLVGLWQEFQQAAVAVKRLGDVMNAPAEPYSIVPTRSSSTAATIEVTDVSFRYSDHAPFLYEHLSMKVESGACAALIGPSGCGKSTLARLMQGFYLPTHGHIAVAARDTRHMAANELRQHFGVVPQETRLFAGTLYHNLTLANPHATFDQVVQACRMAEIHDTIERLPHGYQTEVGEHGVGLSGGQRQRIAIARALLKRPRILIFDEATSNLDAVTAEQFARTINQLRGRVTMLFIAHQLPRALKVDQVVDLGQCGSQEGARRCA